MKKKFNAPKTFLSCKMNQEKTRKINQEYFKDIDLVEVRELIKIFESIYSSQSIQTFGLPRYGSSRRKKWGMGLRIFI
jgi:hypothetical protein